MINFIAISAISICARTFADMVVIILSIFKIAYIISRTMEPENAGDFVQSPKYSYISLIGTTEKIGNRAVVPAYLFFKTRNPL